MKKDTGDLRDELLSQPHFSCRNLPEVLETAEQEGKVLVLEEFIQGDTLDFLLKAAPLSPKALRDELLSQPHLDEYLKENGDQFVSWGLTEPSSADTAARNRPASKAAGFPPAMFPDRSVNKRPPPQKSAYPMLSAYGFFRFKSI